MHGDQKAIYGNMETSIYIEEQTLSLSIWADFAGRNVLNLPRLTLKAYILLLELSNAV